MPVIGDTTMLKKLILAMMPLTLLTSNLVADDDLTIDTESIVYASAEEVDLELDIDVDALADAAGKDADEDIDAIEACFRRCGYGHRGWGHGFHNSCYNNCYNNYYSHCHSYCRPLYSYRTINYCPPVIRCVPTPVYHYYWGCY